MYYVIFHCFKTNFEITIKKEIKQITDIINSDLVVVKQKININLLMCMSDALFVDYHLSGQIKSQK